MATSNFVVSVPNTIKISLDEGAVFPAKAHEADAGYDLSCIKGKVIRPHGSRVFDTGVHIAIPIGCVGYVQGRSGLNVKHNIFCPTGTIDSGYTGSIKVKLYNFNDTEYVINAGDKIAQLVIQPIMEGWFELVDTLDETDRGDNGFGSTGR